MEEWQETHGWHDSDVGSEVFDLLADFQGKPTKITFEDHFYGNTVKEKMIVTSDKVMKTKDDKGVSVNEIKISDDKLVGNNQKLLSDTVRVISDQIRAKLEGDIGRHNQPYLPSTELTLSRAGVTSGIDGFTPPPR